MPENQPDAVALRRIMQEAEQRKKSLTLAEWQALVQRAIAANANLGFMKELALRYQPVK